MHVHPWWKLQYHRSWWKWTNLNGTAFSKLRVQLGIDYMKKYKKLMNIVLFDYITSVIHWFTVDYYTVILLMMATFGPH